MDQLLSRRMLVGLVPTLGRETWRFLRAIHRAHQRSRQRRALAQLSDGLLDDIGLTRHDIAREIAKPCWRP